MAEHRALGRLLAAMATLAVPLGANTARADDLVPVPWNGMDIGDPKPAGGSLADGAAFTLTAGGAGLGGMADQFHYVYQSVTGDFALVARVTFPADSPASAEAGLMVRDALAATTNFAAVSAAPGHGVLSQYRTSYSPVAGAETAASPSAPVWVRLVKRGTTVDGYFAADVNAAPGAWKKVGDDHPIPSGMVYVGLCLAGHDPATIASATFDHVALSLGPQPALDDGTYTLTPVSAPALALSAVGAGTALATPDGTRSQEWVLTDKGGGRYAVQSASDRSLALTVAGGRAADGARAVLQADQGLPSQRWSLVPLGRDTYGLIPQCAPDRGLDDLGGNATPQAVIDIWQRWDGDPHTQWTLTPAP